MAEQADAPEREDEPEDIIDQELDAPLEGENGSDEGLDQTEGDEPEEEVEISFDGEAAPASRGEDSELVRRLRAEIRKRDERLAALPKVERPQIVVGEKPTMESCDYEEDKFAAEYEAWTERKAKADEADAQARKSQEAVQAAWTEQLADFGRKKTALKVPNFEASEEAVVSTLSQVQQAIVIKAADDSAKVIYALGRHPEKLNALAAIDDPIKFTAAVVKLEGNLTVTTRRKAPEPEGVVRGSAPLRLAGEDKVLARLEAEAERTNDRTKVVQYKRQLREKANKR